MVVDHIEALNSTATGTVVADSAIYTADNLRSFKTNAIKWITRVPNQIKETKKLMHSLSIERMIPHSSDNRYAYISLGNEYAEVKQQWVVVHSLPAKERAKKSISKKLDKLVDKELKSYKSLQSSMFACEEDAIRALAKLLKSFVLLEAKEVKILTHKRYKKRGKPNLNQEAFALSKVQNF